MFDAGAEAGAAAGGNSSLIFNQLKKFISVIVSKNDQVYLLAPLPALFRAYRKIMGVKGAQI